MLRSLFSAISGLRANQTMLDVTGNNIANANTVGFKSSNVVFQDTLSQMLTAAGAPTAGPPRVGRGGWPRPTRRCTRKSASRADNPEQFGNLGGGVGTSVHLYC